MIESSRGRIGPHFLRWIELLYAGLLLLGLSAGTAGAQLSPGELSQAHAGLEGSANCLKCHAPRQGVAPDRCLDCHGALAERIEAGEGLHARAEYRSCETCHIEHHGREFELVFWGEDGREAFDHRLTGWPLRGAHGEAACRDCHRPELLQDRGKLQRGGANPRTTFLGLSTACSDCHEDEHRGQLGDRSCADCHTTTAWKPAPGFDHSATSFPLTSAHQKLACAACHSVETDPSAPPGLDATFLRFAGMAHGSCADCHQDPHQGRFGNQCSTCHDPADWRRVDRAGFDHDLTRFPLEGRHSTLSCTSCHRQGASRGKLAFGSCSDCHRDPHQGRLGSACASCHDPSGWRTVELEAFDHDRTRFPLEGEHREVACAACHSSGRATERLAFGACSDCHGDPHLGQLRGAACADCHTVEGFLPPTFTAADHQRTGFPLEGAHRAVACDLCHLKTEAEALPGSRPRDFPLVSSRHGRRARGAVPPAAVTRFRFADTSCETCHGDPHGGETAAFGSCESCHTLESWAAVDLRRAGRGGASFNHGKATGFPLDAGHEGLSCTACHVPGSGPGEVSAGALVFSATLPACGACHADPHFGTPRATAEAVPVACGDCHTTAGWGKVSFDHRRDTGFALEGAHQRLACAACHQRGAPALTPLPTTCEGCHGGAVMSGSSIRR